MSLSNSFLVLKLTSRLLWCDVSRPRTELPPLALDVLPNGLPASPSRSQVQTLFVYLKGTPEVLAKRMAGRTGHYMVRFFFGLLTP